MVQHSEACFLHPQRWFRHAAAAASTVIAQPAADLVDRAAGEALVDALAYFVELGNMEVTLRDVVDHALVMDPSEAESLCDCGAASSS